MTAGLLRDITEPGAPRPAARPRLVCIDLDGTCVDERLQMHPRTIAAVQAAQGAGITVVVATGRMYRSALPFARQLGISAPLICYQGATVRDMPRPGDPQVDGIPLGRLVSEEPVPPELALAALQVARGENWHFQAYQNEQLLCEQDRPEAHLYASIARVPITLVDDLVPLLQRGSVKCACVIDGEAEAQRAEMTLRTALGGQARVVRSLPPFVEITNAAAGKGRALLRLCEVLEVPASRVVAIGDAPNDVDMLEAAGFSVAVRGARPEVLAAADAVCAPPEQAGVADVLEVMLV